MREREDGNGSEPRAPRARGGGFFRAIVVAAAAAAASAAGCYDSDPGEDVVSDADAVHDDAMPGDTYGLPDGHDGG